MAMEVSLFLEVGKGSSESQVVSEPREATAEDMDPDGLSPGHLLVNDLLLASGDLSGSTCESLCRRLVG